MAFTGEMESLILYFRRFSKSMCVEPKIDIHDLLRPKCNEHKIQSYLSFANDNNNNKTYSYFYLRYSATYQWQFVVDSEGMNEHQKLSYQKQDHWLVTFSILLVLILVISPIISILSFLFFFFF
jgi:hypothetical protein